jgi:cytochrome P450
VVGHLPRFFEKESVELWDTFHAEVPGDIFEVDVGFGKSVVVTKSPAHAQLILAHQGRDSVRTPMHSWDAVHRERGWPKGIPWATGDDHRRSRQVLGETLLTQKSAKQYVPLVVPCANRYADCLEAHLRGGDRLPQGATVTTLTSMFALEAVMKVVVGSDFPALTYPLNPDAVEFARSVAAMFTETAKVEQLPQLHIRLKTGSYRRLSEAWETMVRYPSATLAPALEHYRSHGRLPPGADGTVLPRLLEQHEAGDLTLDEVKHVGVQAVAAAVDTTAQTTEYLFYNLARNPDVQEELHRTVAEAVGSGGDLRMTIEQYEGLEYLRASLKESMRYTPTIGVHARTLTRDADLGDGHLLRKGQLVLINFRAMAMNDRLYPSPEVFLPERFLKPGKSGKSGAAAASAAAEGGAAARGCPLRSRDRQAAVDRGDAVHTDPYAAIPFGHGARKCVGKAFAEMDVHLATAAVLRRYRIEYDGPPLRVREESLLRPVEPLTPHFKFVARE